MGKVLARVCDEIAEVRAEQRRRDGDSSGEIDRTAVRSTVVWRTWITASGVVLLLLATAALAGVRGLPASLLWRGAPPGDPVPAARDPWDPVGGKTRYTNPGGPAIGGGASLSVSGGSSTAAAAATGANPSLPKGPSGRGGAAPEGALNGVKVLSSIPADLSARRGSEVPLARAGVPPGGSTAHLPSWPALRPPPSPKQGNTLQDPSGTVEVPPYASNDPLGEDVTEEGTAASVPKGPLSEWAAPSAIPEDPSRMGEARPVPGGSSIKGGVPISVPEDSSSGRGVLPASIPEGASGSRGLISALGGLDNGAGGLAAAPTISKYPSGKLEARPSVLEGPSISGGRAPSVPEDPFSSRKVPPSLPQNPSSLEGPPSAPASPVNGAGGLARRKLRSPARRTRVEPRSAPFRNANQLPTNASGNPFARAAADESAPRSGPVDPSGSRGRPSSVPTSASLAPTAPRACEGSVPERCGCASLSQMDYRGSLNTTADGDACVRWDSDIAKRWMEEYGYYTTSEDFPDSDLENNNHCRNPDGTRQVTVFCWKETSPGYGVCDVPTCEELLPSALPTSPPSSLPSTSALPSISPFPTLYPTISHQPSTSPAPTVTCFASSRVLKASVNEYTEQGCATDPSCTIGQLHGWPINSWCVSQVTNMDGLFLGKSVDDISAWDVAQVTSMGAMFVATGSFRGNLSAWNVSRVTHMKSMFYMAQGFNEDLSAWDVAQVTNMDTMFSQAPFFNQNLCAWADKVQYDSMMKYIFLGSNCPFPQDPEEERQGPFCASTCKPAMVAWSTSDQEAECKAPPTLLDPTFRALAVAPADDTKPTPYLPTFPPTDESAPTEFLTMPSRILSLSPTYSYDCLCDHANAFTGYVQKPYTNCASYIQCSGGRMVQERSCPAKMIFDTKLQQCNWEGGIYGECEELSSFDDDVVCQCKYAKTECTRSLQDLTAETISAWVFPTECAMANDICSAGDSLFQYHKSEVCAWCIGPACEEGTPQSQSCLDRVTHCCGGASPDCQCGDIQAACERGNAASCSVYAETCCNGVECKCDHMTKSCSLRLESAVEDATLSEDCLDAEETCCTNCLPVQTLQSGITDVASLDALDDKADIGSCQCSCNFWDELCTSNPGPACLFFAGRCCGSPEHATHNAQCYCEIEEYLKQNLNLELDYKDSCSKAKDIHFLSSSTKEKEALEEIFTELGGTEWQNKIRTWDNTTEHCDWFGVKCENKYIVEIDLAGNNLVGTMNVSRFFAPLNKLEVLKLAENKLEGVIDFNSFYQLWSLKHVDLSHNNLSGEVDVLLAPALQYLNLSRNNFASLMFFKFRGSQNTFEKLDLSQNNIRQDVSQILENTPPSLKELVLAENHVHGSLPNPLPVLVDLERFILRSNNMMGQIPDLSRSFQQLQELDLSNQTHANTGGLSGPIPDLPDLVILDLSANKLTGAIPPGIGNLLQLKKLVVSNNMLSSGIPTNLRKLAGICEELDMSNNVLTTIPPQLEDFRRSPDTLVNLTGNADIVAPAPLGLCYVDGFDLQNDTRMCPPERKVLNKFYDSAKGGDWTNNSQWTLQQNDHCYWHGVTCINGSVTELNLTNNGLSGRITTQIGELRSLKVLDVSDNDIKGTIPTEIGKLSSLTHLRLSFNSLVNTVPTELRDLQPLELVHLHGNRLWGIMPALNTDNLKADSSFVSDCGAPADFVESLTCPDCTICCNSYGDCHIADDPESTTNRTVITICTLSLVGYIVAVVVGAYVYEQFRPQAVVPTVVQDRKYAQDSIGRDSIYSYFLSKSRCAKVFALTVVVCQVWFLSVFVMVAGKDFDDDKSDYVYSWKCPRDSLECKDGDQVRFMGWILFVILMAAHLLKDLINGLKLLILCGQRRHAIYPRIGYFMGGVFLTLISIYTIYASIMYNTAIARSDTGLLANVVIIMFVVDVDEHVFKAVDAARTGLRGTRVDDEHDEELAARVSTLTTQVAEFERRLRNEEERSALSQNRVQQLERQVEGLIMATTRRFDTS